VAIGAWLFGSRLLSALGLRRASGQSHHEHDHEEAYAHDHEHDNSHAHEHSHEGHHDHSHAAGHVHSHGLGQTKHSHGPPQKVSFKSLLALSVSGGLLPCPEALIVLLITIAAHRVLFGLLLILAFSTGLASTCRAGSCRGCCRSRARW
jgi:nickel/cobalt exporter